MGWHDNYNAHTCALVHFMHTPDTYIWEMQEGQEEAEEVDSPFLRRQHPSPMLDIGDSTGGGLQGVLGQLFSVLLQEIESFITFGERLDS